MSKPIFYEGQAVGCLIFGEGVISEINDKELDLPIKVSYRGFNAVYKVDGRYVDEGRPTLYPIDQYREIIAKLPAPQPEKWKPKPGEWCWFWDNGYKSAILNMLVSIEADKQFPYMTKTGTSYHNCAQFVGELPPHMKEVQP